MKKKAIFPGTFDPFTIGHKSLVDRALNIVDSLIIAIGVNEKKDTLFTLEERINFIKSVYSGNPHISVKSYDTLTVDFAKREDASFIIRGIRSINDFEYERNISDINRELEGIDTLILFTEPKYAHVSSTIARELIKYGRDVSSILPNAIKIEKTK